MAGYRPLFILAAICSLISAVTTLVLIFGPELYPAPRSLEDRIALLANPAFELRMWVAYVHPFVSFVAAIGVYLIARRLNAGFALLGIIFVGMWAFTEALQQALSIVAQNWTWRGTYAAADETTKAFYRSHMDMFNAIWDGLYFLLLTAFLLGYLFFALTLVQGRPFDVAMSGFFFAASVLSVLYLINSYGGPIWAGAVAQYAYPIIQPLGRALAGIWILRRSRQLA